MKKKKILIIVVICCFVGLSYITVHTYGNSLILERYGESFEKNKLGDYALNKEDVVLAIYKVPFFRTETNLSASCENVALIIWCSPWKEKLRYGVIISDEKTETSYQIEINKHFQAIDEQDQVWIEKNADKINQIIKIVGEVWDIKMDYL